MKMSSGVLAGIAGLAVAFTFAFDADAQGREKNAPDASQRGVSGQVIGVNTEITFEYHRPGVKGREVFGADLVPYDKVWRAGANETTKITFSGDVTIDGKPIAAGSYGFHLIPKENGDWTVIITTNWQSWGFSYEEGNDVLRFTAKAVDAPHQEQLIYGFDDVTDNSAMAFLHREKKKVSFKVEVAE